MFYLMALFGIFASIVQAVWLFILLVWSKSVFTVGFYLVFVISLFHLSFFLTLDFS